jgi:hypothetical protein
MKRKEAVDQLREIQEIANIEVAHRLADDILCRQALVFPRLRGRSCGI